VHHREIAEVVGQGRGGVEPRRPTLTPNATTPAAAVPATTREQSAAPVHQVPGIAGPNYAEMMARYLGPSITAAFADEDVTEIYVNPQDGRVRVNTYSQGKAETGGNIGSDRLEMFLNAVATAQGITLGAHAPTLQAELPEGIFRGARLQGFVAPAASGVAIVVRKRPTRVFPLASYVAGGLMSPECRDTLKAAIAAHKTIIVAGGTGTGKSTLLGALLQEIAEQCPHERVVVLEDTVELNCPVRDHLALRTTAELSLAALVKATLRTSPNRIVIGEVRDQAALDFLDAAVTGHPGGLCTVHASTALGALARLDRLAQRANVPPQRELVADAVDLVVVLQGDHQTRRVSELVRVAGLTQDKQFILEPVLDSNRLNPIREVAS